MEFAGLRAAAATAEDGMACGIDLIDEGGRAEDLFVERTRVAVDE